MRLPEWSVNVRPYEDSVRTDWDQFVQGHPEATIFHSTVWKRAIERAFRYEGRYLLAEQDGRVCGVLPLFLVSNWVQGRALISTPFAVYGGIAAQHETAKELLVKAACKMARDEGTAYLELRACRETAPNGFLIKRLYVSFDCALESDPELMFRRLPKDTRYMVRKGRKNGLRLVTDPSQLDTFYEIYADNVRRLGTPVFSKRYFRTLCEEFGDAVEISVVWHCRRAVASVLSFRFRNSLLPYYGGALPEGRELGANNFMYWELIRGACERGLRHYDFGRSKIGTGSHFFKTQWCMKERPLPYQYYLVRRKSLPNFSPVNSRFKLAIALWKHMPLGLTKALGPALARLFP
jgi:FemAB-related protein (PEP-CTERM system-associated)